MFIVLLLLWGVCGGLYVCGKIGNAAADQYAEAARKLAPPEAPKTPTPAQERRAALADFKKAQAAEEVEALTARRAELLKLAAAAELLNKHAATDKERLSTAQKMLYYDEQIRRTDKAIARAYFDAQH